MRLGKNALVSAVLLLASHGAWAQSFTASATPGTLQTALVGNSRDFIVTFATQNGFSQPIDVDCANLAAGMSCAANPPTVLPGTPSVVTVSTTAGVTPLQITTFQITGTSGSTVPSNNLQLRTTDFSLSSTTVGSAQFNVAASGTRSVQAKAFNGFTGTVTLACVVEGLPTGVTCSVPTSTIPSTTGVTFTTTVSASAATAPGNYIVDVVGTNSGQQRTYSFTAQVKDFTLALGTGAITLPQPPAGQSSTVTVPVTLTALNGFNTSTALSCTGQPTGVTCTFAPASGVPTALGLGSTLTLTGASTAVPGDYNLTVKATAGALVRTQPLAVHLWGPNFTQAVTPTIQNVTAGSSTQYTVTYTPLGGMTQDIAVSCGTLPAGVHCTPNPATVTPGVTPLNQSVVTLSTDFGVAVAANDIIAIIGTSAPISVTRSTNVTLSVKDFTVTANTPTVATNVGTNITDTLLVKGLNGFAGNVALGCVIVGTPAGTNCTLSNVNPAASATGTSVTATITSTAATTPFGTYAVQVTGTNSGQSKKASFTVNIKDFTLALGTGAITLPQPPAGQSSSLTVPVTLTALNSYNTSTTLSCTGQPVGVTCAFAPLSLIPTGVGINSTLTITGASTAVAGDYNLTVKGTAGALVRTQPLAVHLWGPNFTQAVTPTIQNVTAGSSTQYTVTYTPLGGMTQDIAVSCGTLPAGVHCTPNPATVTPGVTPLNQSVVTLSTDFGVAVAANDIIAIIGTSAPISVTRSTNVTLSVKDFTVTANTPTVATNVGTNITDTILVKGLNGFTGNVALGCVIVGTPAGTNCTLSNVNPAASATGTSVTATITSTAATTPFGTYAVQVTGTNSGQSKKASFTLNIKDFNLAAGTNAVTIPQPPAGQSSTVTVPVTLTALNGFNTSTALSCTGQPTGVTCAFAPASGIPTGGGLNSTVTVTGASTAVAASFPLTVKATAGTLVRQQVITVTLWGPNFTQAIAPTTQNVTSGAGVPYTVTFTPLGGMTQDIAVSCGALPNGVHCTPNPAVVTPGVTPLNQSVVTLSTDFGVAVAANDIIAIIGTSAPISVTRSTNVTLSVKDFSVTANTPTVATNVGTNITDTILVKGLNGFTGNVALGCVIVGAPAGMNCTLSNVNPAASSTGTSVTATISSTVGTTAAGTYTVQVTGTNSAQSKTASFTVNIKSIANAVSPPVQSVQSAGSQANFTVTTTALNGFAGSVTLSCLAPLPTGLSCGFGPSNTATLAITPIGTGTNTNLRVTVANGTPVGQYHLTAKAASGTTLIVPALFQLNVGVPVITAINPGSGAWGQTVNISGSAFDPTPSNNSVLFNGVTASVIGGSATNLSVIVPQNSTTGNVTVTTAIDSSNPFAFTVQNLVPTVSTVTPNALTVGSLATIINLSGTDFVPGAQVQLDGVGISTNFVLPTQITATITQAQAASSHVYAITVFNPAPGGGTSSASNFVITPVDDSKSTVVAVPNTNVLANNVATSTITVTLKNSASAGVSGQTVQISSSGTGNTISTISATTNGSGVATFTIKSTKAELKTISATVTLNPGGNLFPLISQATVGFKADASTLSAGSSAAVATPPTGVLADGVSQSAITVQVVDAFGNPVAGQTISLASTGSGNVLSANAATDANGTYVGSIASTVAELKTITVTANPGGGQTVLTAHPTVTFVTPVARFAYVANTTDNTVSGYTVEVTTGQLRHNGYALTGTSPVAVATDTAGKFLYVANSGSANVSGYTIATDGYLNPMLGSPFTTGTTAGAAPKALSVDPSGKYLFVANYGDSTVTSFSIDPLTGVPSSVSNIGNVVNPSALFGDPRGKYLYVANSGGGSVSGFSIDQTSGDLTTLGTSPFTSGTTPLALAGDRAARFVYAVNNGTNSVTSYTLDLTTGTLANSVTTPTGAGPTAIVIHPSGTYAYVANSDGTVSMFSVDQSDGHLSPLGTPTITAGTSPSTISMDPAGQYVFVGNSGSNDVSIFNVNGTTGQLTVVTTSSPTVRARVSPAGMVVTQGSTPVTYAPKYAYVAQDSGSVNAYSVNTSTGNLTSIPGGVGGLGDSRADAADLRGKFLLVGVFSGASLRSYSITNGGALSFVNSAGTNNSPFAVAVDPSGRFAYVANKGSGTVSSYTMNSSTGVISRNGGDTAPGTAARDVTVDPTGRFVYAADDSNSKVTAFRINSNGILSQTGSQMGFGGAFGVKVDPAGRFLYVVGQNATSVGQYNISPNDGSLSPAGSNPSSLSVPHSVEVSPNGRFSYAANTSSNTVSGFTVNLSSGALANIGSFDSGSNSFQVRCDPSGKFLYVPNKLGNSVSIFTINPVTGILNKVTDLGGLSGPHQIAITGVLQ